jgi:branched-chain amino acid transport system ATP-binding protein
VSTLVRTHAVSRRFGGLQAVDDVDLEVLEGEVLGLIGPNGAGKTTFVNLLSGHLACSSGRVEFAGAEITHWPPHRRARAGLVRTFQQVRLFPQLSVRTNVEIGAFQRGVSGLLQAAVASRRARQDEHTLHDAATAALESLGLSGRAETPAGELSTGEQRLVGMARALAARPRLLVLDEPAAGLNESETVVLQAAIRSLPAQGITTVVVEHHMKLIMAVCDRIAVLTEGRLLAVGSPAEVRSDSRVIEAYLGRSAA